MHEVRSRVFCSGDGCKECLEYWATIDITSRDTSDTFQTSSTPEISISGPDPGETGWYTVGGWTRRSYCPSCNAIRVEEERQYRVEEERQYQAKRRKS